METMTPELVAGVWTTLQLSVLIVLLSTVPGLFLGWLCSLSLAPVAAIFRFIANALKVVPPILFLIVLYFAVFPALGLASQSAFSVAAIALGIAFIPLQADVFRLLFDASLRLEGRADYPEFIRRYFTNLALVLRDSSLASIVAVPELFRAGQQITSITYEPFQPYAFILVFYLSAGLLLIYLGKVLAWGLMKIMGANPGV